ncbi:recombinase family protein [Nonomuraea endophytica]|uniref:recombinase family protein n=1 Tax=Nonomuraea endophytica TaxID=714136 RepID=UPI0037C8E7F6
MDDMLTTEFDGCGLCLVGVRRLSRKSDSTSSPQRQADQILRATSDIGGHIVAWADDWEVSGATDPMTRPQFGPWLRGEMGPYNGIAAASVDRVGRNVRDTLNTQDLLTHEGRVIVTADHSGIWEFTDPSQENEWLIKAWGSQMELRAIQKRNRDETLRARQAGEPKQKPSYGYIYIRLYPNAKVDHIEIDPIAAEIIRNVAERVLTDATGKITCATEAARLNREGIPSPSDRRAQIYGRPMKGSLWTAKTIQSILCSQAALGYLMHDKRPVVGSDGKPVRIADPLWDHATHLALVEATAPKRRIPRAPKGEHLLSGNSFCGNCGGRLYVCGDRRHGCTGRVRGVRASANCKPAPSMDTEALNEIVGKWFVLRYGAGELMRRIYDPGTGHAAQIMELTTTRTRLRDDRQAGLYDSPEDAEWFRIQYRQIGEEIAALKRLPERKPGMRMVSTGRTIAEEWAEADSVKRREMLAEFDVRVVLHPHGSTPRVVMTGMDLHSDGLGMTG